MSIIAGLPPWVVMDPLLRTCTHLVAEEQKQVPSEGIRVLLIFGKCAVVLSVCDIAVLYPARVLVVKEVAGFQLS